MLRFEVPALTLSTAFAVLEEGKRSGAIRDFSLAASTLEGVFLRFARLQEAADEAFEAARHGRGRK